MVAAIVAVTGAALTTGAQTVIDKANSYNNLATASDWSGTVVPGPANVAVWTSSAGTPSVEPLGTNLSWDGIEILNPLGPVTISADGNSLTNGVAGINLMQAGQSLTMSNNVVLNVPQYWQVGNNQTLSVQGGVIRNQGGAVLFSFDNSASAAAYVQTNTAGAVVANNIIMTDGSIGNGTGTGVPIATYNDVDYAALNQNGQVVPGASIGYSETYNSTPIYLSNPNGNPPTAAGGSSSLFYDFTNTTSEGIRINTTTYVLGFRFNNFQTNTTYTYGEVNAIYGGVPAWNVLFKSGSTLDVNSILVTTNDGTSPVVFTSSGSVRLSIGVNEMTIFQNNPAAPLVFQSPITERSSGSDVAKYGPGTVEYQAACSYNAGTYIYGGTVLIDGAGQAGVGPINVLSGGNFEGENGAVNIGPVTVASGATNSVLLVSATTSYNNATNLTFNAGTSCLQFIYSNGVAPSTTVPAMMVASAGTALALNGAVNVNVMGGSFADGQYPLVKYGTLSGNGFAALNLNALPPEVWGYLSNSTLNSTIYLVITNVGQPLAWNTGSAVWDTGVTADWLDALGNTTNYQQVLSSGENVVFNDNAPGPSITVTLNTNPIPASVTVSNNNDTYVISGNGSISGSGVLTKADSGTLTLSTTNAFMGGINLNGGTVNFSTLPNLGGGAINFGGGALQYNGNSDDISARIVTFNAGGATINIGSQNVNYANPVGNGGPGGLAKLGSGTLTLNGASAYTGNTLVGQGTLELGAGSSIPDSPVITVNSGAVLDTAVSGVNLGLSSGQTLAGLGQVNGVVTAVANSTIVPATNGVIGTLSINGGLNVNNCTLNMTFAPTSNSVIAVTGPLEITSLGKSFLQMTTLSPLPLGRYVIITYSGSLSGVPAYLTPEGFNQPGALPVIDSTVSGQIAVDIVAAATNNITWSGSGDSWDDLGSMDWLNGSTPWAFTNGDTVTFNDSASGNPIVDLQTNLVPTSVVVSNTAIPTYTFVDGTGLGNGLVGGSAASFVKDGAGTAILATANSYGGSTTIKNGTLQIGNGAIGDIGSGNVTNNAALVFDQGDGTAHSVQGVVSGAGTITVNLSAGTAVAMAANNTYTGPTTISNGVLQVGFGSVNNAGVSPDSAGSLGGSVVTNNGTLLLNRAGAYSFTNHVTGSGIFADAGSGTVTLGGTNFTYLSDTSISNGVLKLGANNELPNYVSVPGSTGILNLDGSPTYAGTLDLNGNNVTVNALSGNPNIVNGTITDSSTSTSTTNTLAVLTTESTTYNGVIKDSGTSGAKVELVVLGSGNVTNQNTLTLSPTNNNNNTFSGGMLISNAIVTLGAAIDADPNGSSQGAGDGPITLIGNGGLIVDGAQGTADNGETWNPLANTIIVPAGQTGTAYGPVRGDIDSTLTGSGVFNFVSTFVRTSIGGAWSGFTGQIVLSGNGNSTGNNTAFDLNSGVPNAGIIMSTDVTMYCKAGGTFPIGYLAGGDSSDEIEGTNSGNGGGVQTTFAIGSLNTNSVYTGGFIDNNNLVKVGTGTFTMNCGGVLVTQVVINGLEESTFIGYESNIVDYTGTTTVSNGTLALDVPVVITNSPVVTLASPNAVLDARDMGYISNLTYTLTNGATQLPVVDSIFEVVSAQTLAGIGTLNGFLQADPGSIFNVGLPIGVFNVTSNASLSGVINMTLNTTNATATNSELAAASFTITGATLVVTNAGLGLYNGSTFQLFNQGVSGFASVTLPVTDPTGGSNYVWQTNLTLNGSITLISGGLVLPTNPPPINFSLSAGALSLAWPPNYLGYILQVQTNKLSVGIGTNWVTVPNSPYVTNMSFNVIPTNGSVFYRLIR